MPQEISYWSAVHVRPGFEKAIAKGLRNKGCSEFLPLYRSKRIWSDRIAEVEIPLFPGYLFCRIEAARSRTPILSTRGVIQFVGIAGKPSAIDEAEIEAIRKIVNSGLAVQPCPYIKIGNAVRIEYGSLAGVAGTVIEIKKHRRLVVSVDLLQRSVAVELEREWVAPCSPLPGPGLSVARD